MSNEPNYKYYCPMLYKYWCPTTFSNYCCINMLSKWRSNRKYVALLLRMIWNFRPLQSILAECRIVLELSLALNDAQNFRYEPGNILICGDCGVGKTTFSKILQDMVQKTPYFVHVNIIECRTLKGKNASFINSTTFFSHIFIVVY